VAGLLDTLFQPQGGGLLDFLRQNAMNQQFGGGLPSDQAQYAPMQVPMQAMAQMPLAQPAAPPPNAQPAQAQPQPQAQPQQGGFLQSLNENFQNMGNGGSLIGALTGQSPSNQTAQFLASKGIDPAMAKTIASDPGLLRSVLPSIMGTGGQTDDIKEYQFAKREDPSLTFNKFMQQKKAVSGEYSLTPQYGTDKDGNTVMVQTGKSGEAIQTKLPAGVKISSGVEKIDLGTSWGLVDKRTGAMVGTQPKDVAGKESAEKVGQAQGTAKAALANGADIDAEATKKKIDDLMSNEGFSSIFGSLDQYRPAWTMDAAGKDARTRFEQLKGTAFLSAYAMLKGGGAITDIEGQKAGAAMARLDRSLSEDEAKQALRDFKEAVDAGLQKLKRAAGGGAEAPATTSAPPKRIRLNADGTIAQ
jgi:hypothetical protein